MSHDGVVADLIRVMQPASSLQVDTDGTIYVEGEPLSGREPTKRTHTVARRDLKPQAAIGLGRGRFLLKRPLFLYPDHWGEARVRRVKKLDLEHGVTIFHEIVLTAS